MIIEQKHEIQLKVCIDEVETDNPKLSQWECDFIQSLDDQITNKHFISEKQKEILQRIYDKVV
jgi:hypothetical protein